MSSLLRMLIVVILGLSAVDGLGQRAWGSTVPESKYSKMARDSSGMLYFVAPKAEVSGRRAYVRRLSPSGEVLQERLLGAHGSSERQYSVRSIAVDAQDLFVVLQVRAGGGAGTLLDSQFLVVQASNFQLLRLYETLADVEFESVASNGTQFALLQRSTATGVGSVAFYDRATYTKAATVNLGNVASVVELKMDAAGNAYVAANNSNGTVQISKCSAAGGLAFQTTLDAPSRANEKLARLEVDIAVSRIYAIGTAEWSPTDQDVMMYIVNSSNGAQVNIQPVAASSANEFVGDLSVVPSGGAIASATIPNSNSTFVIRRNGTGTLIWSRSLADTPGGYRRSHAYDPDANLAVMSPFSTTSMVIDRINPVTGVVANRSSFWLNPDSVPHEMRMDAGGSMFITADEAVGATLMRVQPAKLRFIHNNVVGGTTNDGRVELVYGAKTEQVWAMTSLNPGVASVPATVTVAQGNWGQNFPIATSPVAVPTNVSINMRYSGFIDQQTLTVIPPSLWQLYASPVVVTGGVLSTGSIQLVNKAPTGGMVVNLSSNKPLVASVPASVTVSANTEWADFPITTYAVSANQGVVITATVGTSSKTRFMAVNAPALTSISVTPTTIKGGLTGTLTLSLNGIAPTGGFSIVLFSGLPGIVMLPASTSVSAGQTTRNVSMPTAAVTTTLNVTILATRSGIYRTATLTVTP